MVCKNYNWEKFHFINPKFLCDIRATATSVKCDSWICFIAYHMTKSLLQNFK